MLGVGFIFVDNYFFFFLCRNGGEKYTRSVLRFFFEVRGFNVVFWDKVDGILVGVFFCLNFIRLLLFFGDIVFGD